MNFKKHIPFHLYLENAIYFVTAGTLNKRKFFDVGEKKGILKTRLNSACSKFMVELFAWVILSNHYHLLFQFKKNLSLGLGKFIGFINGGSAFDLNKLENKKGRQIWWNYWDNCIRNEETFYKRFNYIHHNPVKHNHSKNLEDYKFSSYNFYINKFGSEYINSIWERYPIIDFSDEQDDF
ncbi:MAG: transposase [Candidatus Aminicenantia bacterium]